MLWTSMVLHAITTLPAVLLGMPALLLMYAWGFYAHGCATFLRQTF